MKTREIRPSSVEGNSTFHDGVYLTRLAPLDKRTYYFRSENGPLKKKANSVLKLKLRKLAVMRFPDTNDVLLYPGILQFASDNVKSAKAYRIRIRYGSPRLTKIFRS